MKAARSPREPPHRTPGPRGRVSQQSASSDPSANRGGIIQRESNNSVRFHTTRVIRVRRTQPGASPDVRFTSNSVRISGAEKLTLSAKSSREQLQQSALQRLTSTYSIRFLPSTKPAFVKPSRKQVSIEAISVGRGAVQ